MKIQCAIGAAIAALTQALAIFASDSAMTPERADRLLARAGEKQPSYITPEQAAEIFHVSGTLIVQEDAHLGDVETVSEITIRPVDRSFDRIRIQVAKGGSLAREMETAAKSWTPNSVQERNPFVALRLSDGAKGYYDGYGHAVVNSADGQIDIGVEIMVRENGRDPIEITDSNRGLVTGVMDQSDRGLRFLTAAISRIYPLARRKYQEQVAARELLRQAQKVMDQSSAANGSMSSPPVGKFPSLSSPGGVATPNHTYLTNGSTFPRSFCLLMILVLGAIAIGVSGYILLRRRKTR